MLAAFVNEPGPPESIRVGELPSPRLGPGEILVRVGAVSFNPIDLYIRAGTVTMPLSYPYIVGCDFAGRVEELGPDATRFKVGDRVWGSNQGLLGRQGVAAEFAAVSEEFAYPTPEELSDKQAAAMALVGITAHLGLFRCSRLEAGETVYVPGGSGGVGSMVVQMAKAAGARVAASAGSARARPNLQGTWRRSGARLQDRRRSLRASRLCSRRRRRLVRNPARAEPRGLDSSASSTRQNGSHGGSDGPANFTPRLVLHQRLLALRLCHVQRNTRGTTRLRERHNDMV